MMILLLSVNPLNIDEKLPLLTLSFFRKMSTSEFAPRSQQIWEVA
jgi:hypothetical protein